MSIKAILKHFPRLHRAASALRKRWRPPPRPPLHGARSMAFIAPSRSDGQGRRWTEDAAARGIDIDILPLAQPYRRADGRVMSFLLPPPREKYDGIVVSRSIDLFDHSWSYAFLDRVNALLSDRGTMLVAKPIGPERDIPEEKLIRMFGRAPRGTAGRYLEFGKAKGGLRRPAEAGRSTLDAYWALSDNLINAQFDERLSETIRALGVDRVRPRKPNATEDPARADAKPVLSHLQRLHEIGDDRTYRFGLLSGPSRPAPRRSRRRHRPELARVAAGDRPHSPRHVGGTALALSLGYRGGL